jgi:hypothetical protein
MPFNHAHTTQNISIWDPLHNSDVFLRQKLPQGLPQGMCLIVKVIVYIYI